MTGTKAMTAEAAQRAAHLMRNYGQSGVLVGPTERGGALLGYCPMKDCEQPVVLYLGWVDTHCQFCSATVKRPVSE